MKLFNNTWYKCGCNWKPGFILMMQYLWKVDDVGGVDVVLIDGAIGGCALVKREKFMIMVVIMMLMMMWC